MTASLARGRQCACTSPSRATQPPETAPSAAAISERQGTETILLAEDEESLLRLMRNLFKARGYSVLTARNGVEALEIESSHRGRIDILVTDVTMPALGGRELAERMRKARKGMRVLYISGYTSGETEQKDAVRQDAAFLAKPFTGRTLTAAVRELLDRDLVSMAAAGVR